MAKYVVDGESLTAIADAIRNGTDKTDGLTLAQMPTELANRIYNMQVSIWDLQEEKNYYQEKGENLKANIKDLNAYIKILEARIEELEGGGGDEPTDQTALAGAYTADGTFSNRVYTWDEMVANFENGTFPNFGEDEDGLIVWADGYDVIVPDTVTDTGWLYCTNVVLPATTTRVGWTDNIEFENIYIKATTPPELESGAFDEFLYNATPEQLAKFAIIVPIGCGDAYKSATGWCDYAEYIREGEMPI